MDTIESDDLKNNTYTIMFGPIEMLERYEMRSESTEAFVIKICLSVALIIFMVLSIIGNVCTCAVIARDKTMRTPTNCYLFNLAVSDLLMAWFVPLEIYIFWVPDTYPMGELGCRMHYVIWDCLSSCSILTISAFTVERYLVVTRPFLRQRMALKTRVFKIIAVIWTVSLLLCIPDAYSISLLERKKYVYCYFTSTGMSRIFLLFDIFFFFVFPMTIIIVLYVLIALKLHYTHKKMRHSPVYGKQDRDKAVKMLAAVAGLFFFCWSPYCGYRIMVLTPKFKYEDYYKVWRVLYFFCAINVYFSTVGNPILYSLMSRKFRTAFKDFLKGKASRRRQLYKTTITTMDNYYSGIRTTTNSEKT